MHLSLATVAKMCGGELSDGSNPDLIIINAIIDSRNLIEGSLFVAIKGENANGHTYVKSVITSGLSCASIVHKDFNDNLPNLIYVQDTIIALGLLAHNYRMQFNLPVIAITGSNGKTTVKEMLRSICNVYYGQEHVLATEGNFNNHLGMPLTLLQLMPQHQVAIIEMGMNHSGELNYLSKLAMPTIAVVNNVMLAHAGFFTDLSDIAKAKGEIYNGLIAGGIACINQCLPFAAMWQKQIAATSAKILNYATNDSYCYLKHSGGDGSMILGSINGDINCTLQVLGEHNKTNAVTAATLALVAGCDLNSIATGLNKYSGYKSRLERKTAFNGALIIDDSYNANPESVKAAILAIQELPKPHWFIFADLKELGKFSEESHEQIAKFAFEHGIDFLLTIGQLSHITHEKFEGEKLHFMTNQDIVEYCKQHLPKTVTLLVKGSFSMGLNAVITELIH